MERQVEIRRRLQWCQAEWVELGLQVAARPIRGHHLQNGGLLLRITIYCADDRTAARVFCRRDDLCHHRRMRDIARFATFQGLKVVLPDGFNRGRVCQPRLVEFFHERRIATRNVRRLRKLLNQIAHRIDRSVGR